MLHGRPPSIWRVATSGLAGVLALALASGCGEAALNESAVETPAPAEPDPAMIARQKLAEARIPFGAAVASGDDARVFELADAGNPLALFYRAEKRLASDKAYEKQEAFADMEAAAEAGSPDAQLWVGFRMAQALEGYPWKPNSGIMMVERAAVQDHLEAMYTLGDLYAQDAPMQDLAKARFWYGKAADAGHMAARDAVARMDREAVAAD
ncbi:MAG: hypothetical protein SGJ21_16285 [Alphaproteobacteria bacterium]|nr:hypothetical protein [Alphaproteobacteria bacterium]